MFTPLEIQEKIFKTGIGYDKKEVEQFLKDLSADFEVLQQNNTDLTKKLKDANDNLGYYKSIEKILQKALILAEKTAQDTKASAYREADAIEMEAKAKANLMLADSKRQIELLEHKTLNLMQQYDLFKIHFENLLHAQIELLNSKSYSINTDEFIYKNVLENNPFDMAALHSSVKEHDLDATVKIADADEISQEDLDQIHFDFLKEDLAEKSYQTEDGFEFFTMKNE